MPNITLFGSETTYHMCIAACRRRSTQIKDVNEATKLMNKNESDKSLIDKNLGWRVRVNANVRLDVRGGSRARMEGAKDLIALFHSSNQ